MILTNPYSYTPLSRETINGKRHYCLPDGSKVGSVTTILDRTSSEEKLQGLANWRKFVGEEKAKQITTEAANTGTVMHLMLEQYCLGNAKPPGTNVVQKIAYPMAQEIIKQGLQYLDECWGVELPLYYPGLYAGTTDGAGVWKGKPTIYDYKQTNKPKSDKMVIDYKTQLAAYICAHDEVHGTKIEQGVILMCSRACQYQEWVVSGDELEEYKNIWWDRVEKYYSV